MAIPIKAVPMLTGEIAEDFIRIADEIEHKPRRTVSEDKGKGIADIIHRSIELVP